MSITQELMDTQDMGLSVALICKGYELVQLEPTRFGKRVTFRFRADDSIHVTAQEYWTGALEVGAKQFWNESKNLKTRLYSLGQ